MKNFAHWDAGSWRDGQSPNLYHLYLVVSHDQKNDVYVVRPDERADFVSWVCRMWCRNDDSQADDETDEAFLERIGVNIRELHWSL